MLTSKSFSSKNFLVLFFAFFQRLCYILVTFLCDFVRNVGYFIFMAQSRPFVLVIVHKHKLGGVFAANFSAPLSVWWHDGASQICYRKKNIHTHKTIRVCDNVYLKNFLATT